MQSLLWMIIKATPHRLFPLSLFSLIQPSPPSNSIPCPAPTTQTSSSHLLSSWSPPLCQPPLSLPCPLPLILSPSSNLPPNPSHLCTPYPLSLNKKFFPLCPSQQPNQTTFPVLPLVSTALMSPSMSIILSMTSQMNKPTHICLANFSTHTSPPP